MKKHNDQKLNEVLKDLVGNYKHKPKLYKNKLQTAWEGMMGPTITKYTKSINLRKTTLYITIDSAALKQELSFSKEKIKDRMNEELGEEHIQTVVIR